ncbi:MAG: hypothetical protein QXZ47_06230 [Candidatus Bathyarchaeia archaeon]
MLIETPRKISSREAEKMPETLFGLNDEQVEEALKDYFEAKFPYAYKMKFMAERFGAYRGEKHESKEAEPTASHF